MNRIRVAVSVAVLSLLASTAAQAQTKYYMRSGPIAPKTEAAAATPPKNPSGCNLTAGQIINNFSGSYTPLGDVTVSFSGGDADAKAAIQAHCESFAQTNVCEGFLTSPGKLRMRAFNAVNPIMGGNNGRTFPYAGFCTKN